MKPRYSTILGSINLLLSGSVKESSFSNKFIVSITVSRHSSKQLCYQCILQLYIFTFLVLLMDIFVNFVNFRELVTNELSKQETSKVFSPNRLFQSDVSLSHSVLISSFKTGSKGFLRSADI